MVKLAIWLVNAQPLLKAVATTENASTVAKKGEPAIFWFDLTLIRSIVTQRRTAPILVFSKGLAASARKKATLRPNAQISLHQNASTASKKVSHHSP